MNACPQCGANTVVIDTADTQLYRRRRRACTVCLHRFTTVEISHDEYTALKAAAAGDWMPIRKAVSRAMVRLADVATMIDGMNGKEPT